MNCLNTFAPLKWGDYVQKLPEFLNDSPNMDENTLKLFDFKSKLVKYTAKRRKKLHCPNNYHKMYLNIIEWAH